jgi:hypothetical protein
MIDLRTKVGAFIILGITILGLAIGLGIGFWAGWIAWPVQISNVDTADLKYSAQDNLIALIADTYAIDKDISNAKTRLALLKDTDANARIAALARKSAADNQPAGAHLAALAVALGIRDQEIALIATTATPTLTETPFPTDTPMPTFTPPATATMIPPSTITPTRTATRRATATRTPTSMPITPTIWTPAMSAWPAPKYEPVNVAPGVKFWHLAKAMFCDLKDKHDYCQDLPGGGSGTSTYIMLLDANGTRTTAPIIVKDPEGKIATDEEINTQKSADDMCNCNYSFLSNYKWHIQIGDAPSDAVSGLGLPSNYHVRYFLTFQLLTR